MSNSTEQALLQIAQQIERAVDDEIDRIDQMDDDEILAIRQKRLKQLKEIQARRDEWLRKGHGQYLEVAEPKEFFDNVKSSERIVVHFMRRSTPRCEIIERHLRTIAHEHFETRFCYVDVERIPSLPERFNVMMLPTLMLVEKGHTFHSIIGFDEFGGTDDFTTDTVTQVLAHYGMVNDKGMFAADQNDE
ncbi:ATP binding protein-like protein [Leishmania infantum JPCM5]|uniref:Thioredoxin domain-containing protein 9 n=3 Tax=Leishmania donovani species complex TaxID=38574 RepID=A0A6L0XMA4_LEIIN|nr:ATP binding protein-like protein [Leishmania infantum JPCM5]XP_003863726.1 ATP binding protein-like protein [Leishmania donovani]CAC9527265.1 ATP_binding_protein-like_protein [Leishmania infantum]AYU81864.1 ATP binding protein-like protein [Leishmania donovani]TPP43821.1 Phosducin family protein [Leishmania donovani]CAM71062.1 ATP binding protein-like protein [Leishmania infantum JPCM5]CBZ37042.1 ATP binding protein-like protein [Leishmania donovani]|eukprot:XP_001467989.1 ATP binding protein-like protein [Leishmania infantum JPCM5]